MRNLKTAVFGIGLLFGGFLSEADPVFAGEAIELQVGLGDQVEFSFDSKVGPLAPVVVDVDRSSLDAIDGAADHIQIGLAFNRDSGSPDEGFVMQLEVSTDVSAPSFDRVPIRIHWLNPAGEEAGVEFFLTVVPRLQIFISAELDGGWLELQWRLARHQDSETIMEPLRLRRHELPVEISFELETDLSNQSRGVRIHGEGLIPHGSFRNPDHTLRLPGDRYQVQIDPEASGRGIYRCHYHEDSRDNRQIFFGHDFSELN